MFRDVDDWLESVRWLFREGRYHFNWDAQPLVAEIHETLYGTTDFDEQVFRDRYVRHNEEVLHYFEGRRDRLLVMDITAGDGWNKLCPFLDKKIPERAFPSNTARPRPSCALEDRVQSFLGLQ